MSKITSVQWSGPADSVRAVIFLARKRTMNSIQQKVDRFTTAHELQVSVAVSLLDLVSEVGELCKEYLVETNYGRKGKSGESASLDNEMGDVIYSLAVVGNCLGVDFEHCLDLALDKYKQRLSTSPHPGSNHEN